jgi:hypothetical protein
MNKTTRNALVVGALFCIASAIAAFVVRDNTGESATPGPHGTEQRRDSAFQGLLDVWHGRPSVPQSAASTPPSVAPQDTGASLDAARDMRMQAVADPAALRVLMQRYATERDPTEKQRIKVVLSTNNQPEIIDLAKQLMTSGDAGRRRDGLELAQRLSANSPSLREAIEQLLVTEQSPAVLVQAILALTPTIVEPAEQQQIVSRLLALTQNANTEVRRQSIQSLGIWDRNGDTTEQLKLATNDQAPDVRQAALQALDSIKSRQGAAAHSAPMQPVAN